MCSLVDASNFTPHWDGCWESCQGDSWAKGRRRAGSPAGACVSSLGQSGLCCLSDKQIPSFLMGQVGLSVPELAESVTGSNRHRLFYGARAAQRSLLSCEVSSSCALPLFLWNKLLWMVS